MKHSLIVPTRNRPDFIKRLLNYYSLSNYTGIIMIGDSSDESEEYKVINIIESYTPKLNIKYLHNRNLSADEIGYELAKVVTTEYVSFLPDDDILLNEGINECINFLDKNKDYSAANGNSYYFKFQGDKLLTNGKIEYINKYPMFFDSNEYSKFRIEKYLNNLDNLYMSVFRTKIYLESFLFSNKLNTYHRTYIFGEIIPAIYVIGEGKIASLNVDYLVRQGHDDNLWSKLDWYNFLFVENLYDSHQLLKKSLNNYFENNSIEVDVILKKFYFKYKNIINMKHNSIKKILPTFIYKLFYQLYSFINTFKNKKTYNTLMKNPYFDILKTIKQ